AVHRFRYRAQSLLLLLGWPFAILRLTRRSGHSLRTDERVGDAIGRQWIFHQALEVLVDLQAIAVLENLHVIAVRPRHPVIVAAEGRVTILVGFPFMDEIWRRQMGGQLQQKLLLMREGF